MTVSPVTSIASLNPWASVTYMYVCSLVLIMMAAQHQLCKLHNCQKWKWTECKLHVT